MAVKKRSKVSAEFNMSSLTDIIFLLLIFFMLTSSMVQINMDLPVSDSKTVAPTDLPVKMMLDGSITVLGIESSEDMLEEDIATAVRFSNNKDNATVTIISESGVPWEKIHQVMKIASGLRLKAIIATQASTVPDKKEDI